MLHKSRILKGDKCFLEVRRHIVEVDPDSVLLAVKPCKLHRSPALVICIDKRGLVLIRLIFIEVDHEVALDIDYRAHKHRCHNDKHRKHTGSKDTP